MQYGGDLFGGHSGKILDISWAPLHGRSFHLIVSTGSDNQLIVWRLQVRDIFDAYGDIFERPLVEKLYEIKQQHSILRLKWNIAGCSFAGSSEDGTVTMWQRTVKN